MVAAVDSLVMVNEFLTWNIYLVRWQKLGRIKGIHSIFNQLQICQELFRKKFLLIIMTDTRNRKRSKTFGKGNSSAKKPNFLTQVNTISNES